MYDKLRAIAERKMDDERVGHTLEPTALVHEAYMRLFPRETLAWRSRGEFYFAAARAMRQILIDHARARGRQKRVGGRRRVPLGVIDLARSDDVADILALEEALTQLEASDARAAQIVLLRFYAGLSVAETASAMDLSERTVMRDWDYARAWLARRFAGGQE